jgi:hypothetical protein
VHHKFDAHDAATALPPACKPEPVQQQQSSHGQSQRGLLLSVATQVLASIRDCRMWRTRPRGWRSSDGRRERGRCGRRRG